MARRNLLPIVVLAALVAGVLAYLLMRSDDPGAGGADGVSGISEATRAARDGLLASPQQVRLDLTVEVPKGSEPDNPDLQEISASGVVDLSSGTGELVYDFNELNNAAGFLGHFETMDVRTIEGTVYLDIFADGPPWLSVGPDDIGVGDVARLQEILVTIPFAVPAHLEVEAEEDTSDGISRTVTPDQLATAENDLAAAIGDFLDSVEVDSITVDIAPEEVTEVTLSFSYPGGTAVEARYQFTPQESAPEVGAPAEDEVREWSEIFGSK